jgi:hypothetical protein
VEIRRLVGRHPVRDDLGDRDDPELLRALFTHNHHCRAPVGDLRGVAGGDRPIRPEHRLQLAKGFCGGPGADSLIGVEDHGVAFALGDLEWSDLLCEASVGRRAMRPLVGARRPPVLVCARDRELLVDVVRLVPHVSVVEGVPQAVVDHRVD